MIKTKITNSELKEKLDLIEKTIRLIIFNAPKLSTEEELKARIKEKFSTTRVLKFIKK